MSKMNDKNNNDSDDESVEMTASVQQAFSMLERQKADLEIALSTAIEHGDFVEEQLSSVNNQLVREVEERRRAEDSLRKLVEIIKRQKEDLEIALSTAIEHGDAIEEQLYEVNRQLVNEVGERREVEKQLDSLVQNLNRQKNDLEVLVDTIASHGDEINTQMQIQLNSVQELARTDALTGLWNRRTFDETLEKEWSRLQRMKMPLALILIDIDFFKYYNDALGHQAGDECLKLVSEVFARVPRRSGELAARYGGEEFAMILPQVDRDNAAMVAEQARRLIEELNILHPQSPFGHVTISIGCAVTVPQAGQPQEQLFKNADSALYQAKQKGKNQFVVFDNEE